MKIIKKIIFVTSNKGKVASAKQYFKDTGIELETYDYDLIEPRTDDIQEIAKSKVLQAYEVVKKPCITQDSGFFIEQLNGFPRAFVNFALDTLGIEGILRTMQGIENRKCMFRECLAYYDGKDIEYFFCDHNGILSETIKGKENGQEWSKLWYIFIPDYSTDGRTLSQYTTEETKERRGLSESAIKDFSIWYKKHLKENNQ